MSKRIVIVTGGSEGIGYSIAERFLKDGDTVILTSRREAEGRKAEEELRAFGTVEWVRADVAKEEDCKNLTEYVVKKYGRIDVLANNAGTVGKRGDLLDQDMENIRNVLNTNVMGVIQMTKYAAIPMREQGGGVIVNVGSLCGFVANPESVAYHSSKGAVKMFTQAAARELSPHGIRVVSVAPGWVATPLLRSVMREEDMAYGASLHMQNRIIQPEQVAGAVFLLASEDATAVNGTTLMVDDGYTSFKI